MALPSRGMWKDPPANLKMPSIEDETTTSASTNNSDGEVDDPNNGQNGNVGLDIDQEAIMRALRAIPSLVASES